MDVWRILALIIHKIDHSELHVWGLLANHCQEVCPITAHCTSQSQTGSNNLWHAVLVRQGNASVDHSVTAYVAIARIIFPPAPSIFKVFGFQRCYWIFARVSHNLFKYQGDGVCYSFHITTLADPNSWLDNVVFAWLCLGLGRQFIDEFGLWTKC